MEWLKEVVNSFVDSPFSYKSFRVTWEIYGTKNQPGGLKKYDRLEAKWTTPWKAFIAFFSNGEFQWVSKTKT